MHKLRRFAILSLVLSTGQMSGAREGTLAGKPSPSGWANVTLLRIGTPKPGGYDIQTLPLEDYVAQVVAGESVAKSSPAALEALAITARTFALANRTRHAAGGFDLCNATHCQVLRASTEATRAGAASTRGGVLVFNGTPAQVFYSASCGGHTELASAVWPRAENLPFLVARPDAACQADPEWQSEISKDDLTAALRRAGYDGRRLSDLRIVARTGSGRVARLRVGGLVPAEISGSELRLAVGRMLGWHLVKSTAFDVRPVADRFRFTGKGSGHGVGLCIVGSSRLAAQGRSSTEILSAYFPGLPIAAMADSRWSQTSVTGSSSSSTSATGALHISLPRADEAERSALERLAGSILRDVHARAGASSSLTLEFHSSIQSFRETVGQPWWVGAWTSGRHVQLLPVAVLKSRGDLERVLRREIARALTGPFLDGRPMWVREGAALYFGGERAGILPVRLRCPSNIELAAPASPGALREASARAVACFDREIALGKRWTEIR